MGTTTEADPRLQHPGNSPVFEEKFESLLETPKENRKFVRVKVPDGLVDMFGRPYPRHVVVLVHHFDDYGVLVEGTYDLWIARRALTKVGYSGIGVWGYRPILVGQEPVEWPHGVAVGGRSAVAFYFDVVASLS